MTGEHSTLEKLKALLGSNGVEFRLLAHGPVFTSAESAAVRGVSLHAGAKALVVKAEDNFLMIVLPADFSLDSKSTKRELNCKKMRFASQEEVESLTALKPGAIPPFGSLFALRTYCDTRLRENETIYFNAGSHSNSIGMKCSDYFRTEKPTEGLFGKETA
jgi:Ala-tRNA(Pro) deacylase